MNHMSRHPGGVTEAVLEYRDASFHVKHPGAFVRCAVMDAVILIDDLKYWSIEMQEAYVDARAVMQRFGDVRRSA